jgi:predicted RNA-binding Zn-ribbon protein involved in translation (DUF1610 family)
MDNLLVTIFVVGVNTASNRGSGSNYGSCRMVQIRHDGIKDFTCPHCGAVYEKSQTPARDSGSAECDDCGTIMMEWVDSAIPLFRAKSPRRYDASCRVDSVIERRHDTRAGTTSGK